jgi:5,10-methylene-tetrahydrofolate dehydrogenase/methenyl tetrahydrofolate cyclohydrolase
MNPLALDPLSPIGDTYRATGPLALDPLSPEHTRERHDMKIVVIGGSGLIGSKLVTTLDEHGHEVVAASPDSGVDTLTGQGLAEALEDASVVVDPCWSSPSRPTTSPVRCARSPSARR